MFKRKRFDTLISTDDMKIDSPSTSQNNPPILDNVHTHIRFSEDDWVSISYSAPDGGGFNSFPVGVAGRESINHLNNGNYNAAWKWLETIKETQETPNTSWEAPLYVWHAMAILSIRAGKGDTAHRELQSRAQATKHTEIRHVFHDLELKEAKRFHQQQDYTNAIAFTDSAIANYLPEEMAKHPISGHYLHKSIIYKAQGNYEQSINNYREYMEHFYNEPLSYADSSYHNGDFSYHKRFGLNTHIGLADIHAHFHHYNEAVQTLHSIPAIFRTNTEYKNLNSRRNIDIANYDTLSEYQTNILQRWNQHLAHLESAGTNVEAERSNYHQAAVTDIPYPAMEELQKNTQELWFHYAAHERYIGKDDVILIHLKNLWCLNEHGQTALDVALAHSSSTLEDSVADLLVNDYGVKLAASLTEQEKHEGRGAKQALDEYVERWTAGFHKKTYENQRWAQTSGPVRWGIRKMPSAPDLTDVAGLDLKPAPIHPLAQRRHSTACIITR